MEDYIIPICIDNKINPIFVKANSFILEKYKNNFHSDLSASEKNTLLEQLWLEEFNISIEKRITASLLESEKWKELKFKDANNYSIFLLRWG